MRCGQALVCEAGRGPCCQASRLVRVSSLAGRQFITLSTRCHGLQGPGRRRHPPLPSPPSNSVGHQTCPPTQSPFASSWCASSHSCVAIPVRRCLRHSPSWPVAMTTRGSGTDSHPLTRLSFTTLLKQLTHRRTQHGDGEHRRQSSGGRRAGPPRPFSTAISKPLSRDII